LEGQGKQSRQQVLEAKRGKKKNLLREKGKGNAKREKGVGAGQVGRRCSKRWVLRSRKTDLSHKKKKSRSGITRKKRIGKSFTATQEHPAEGRMRGGELLRLGRGGQGTAMKKGPTWKVTPTNQKKKKRLREGRTIWKTHSYIKGRGEKKDTLPAYAIGGQSKTKRQVRAGPKRSPRYPFTTGGENTNVSFQKPTFEYLKINCWIGAGPRERKRSSSREGNGVRTVTTRAQMVGRKGKPV